MPDLLSKYLSSQTIGQVSRACYVHRLKNSQTGSFGVAVLSSFYFFPLLAYDKPQREQSCTFTYPSSSLTGFTIHLTKKQLCYFITFLPGCDTTILFIPSGPTRSTLNKGHLWQQYVPDYIIHDNRSFHYSSLQSHFHTFRCLLQQYLTSQYQNLFSKAVY